MENSYRRMTDNELARAAAGESDGRAAFAEIIRRFNQPLAAFAVSKTANVQDAEDIVQETFLRAYQKIASFNSDYALKNWLYTIAYRLIISAYRKKRPQSLSEKATEQLAAAQPPIQDHQWLWQAVRQMSSEAFTVLWLRYQEDMTTSEIAQVMKKSKIMIRVLLHRSRVRLAKKLVNQPEIVEQSQWLRGRAAYLERTK